MTHIASSVLSRRTHPLSNFHLSMLQRLGIEADALSTSKGTMRGLEMAWATCS